MMVYVLMAKYNDGEWRLIILTKTIKSIMEALEEMQLHVDDSNLRISQRVVHE
mgnify:CR=1 FL=1